MGSSEQATHVYTVSELNALAQNALEERFPNPLWIEGEVTNFRQGSGDHIYFSLKDASCEARCAFFGGARIKGMNQIIENGLNVLILAQVSLWPKAGIYQLYVRSLQPKGSGALQLAFEKLKKKLADEGLFENTRKKSLPLIIKHAIIVTSADSVALQDFLKILHQAPLKISIVPASVQGETAAQEITEAIDLANHRWPNADVLIVARGGGSLEDLWSFNEEIVARSIARCNLTTISAIGHETDFTIADFVADIRAPTPTAAAQIILSHQKSLQERLHESAWRLSRLLKSHIERLAQQIQHFRNFLTPRKLLQLLEERYLSLDHLKIRLDITLKNSLILTKTRLQSLGQKLELLSPTSVLSRGYAIVSLLETKKIIKEATAVNLDDMINIQLNKGEILCQTKSVKA